VQGTLSVTYAREQRQHTWSNRPPPRACGLQKIGRFRQPPVLLEGCAARLDLNATHLNTVRTLRVNNNVRGTH